MPSEDAANTNQPRPTSGPALEEILDQYLGELAKGGRPDQDEYLRRFPDLADALRGVFKTLDFIEVAGKSLSGSQLERGRRLGDFHIVREVARGGMGVVYEAVQASLGRRVALKALRAGALLSDTAAERFAREAATAGRLHHTNIVPVYGVGREQEIHYYAMQFIEGRSLADHLRQMIRAGTRPGRDYFVRVTSWGRQVADALDYAHQEGIIHRDIKPSNLLLDARDNVWITDFGLARLDAQTTLTTSGDVLGTTRYMSPEQARGGRSGVDARTDIYSLGATLYELLALQPAFGGDSREAVLNQIAFADPRPLRQASPAIPRDLETIVGKCMEKLPERRYQRAGEVAEDCRRFLAHEPIRARRTPTVVKALRLVRRYRLLSLSVMLIVVLSITALGLLLKVRHARGQRRLEEAYQAMLFEQDDHRTRQLLDEAESLGVDSARLHVCRALIPLFDYHGQEALPHVDRALRREPGNVEAKLALALAYTHTHDFDARQRLLDEIAPADIQTALGWLLHGLTLSGIQRSTALESFDRAIRLQRDFTPAIAARAQFRAIRLLTEGMRAELDPMLADYDALVVFRPNSAFSHANRAHGWLSAAAFAATQPDLRELQPRWLERCRADLEQALRLRRSLDAAPLVQQGTYLRCIGDYAGAESAFAQAIAVERESGTEPGPPLVHKHAMMVYVRGDPQAALDEIEPARSRVPGYYPLAVQKALMLAELGRLPEARQACLELLEHHRRHANAVFVAAAMLELVGAPADAAAAVAELASRDPAQFTSEDGQGATPGPAIDYLLGRLDGPGLLAAASAAPGPRCEYAFLVGLRELGRGQRTAGLAALRTGRDTGVFRFLEHHFAQILLSRAEADPTWPRWLSAWEANTGTG